MTAAWHFVRHQSGQPIVNPLGSEHFADADDDWRPGEALVRECIQNSLDARSEEEVSVCFQVRDASSMSAETAGFWFSSLWPHLRSRDCRLPDVASAPQAGGFVVVEDFGTHGLEGDFRQGGLSDTDNRFFNFFRAEGLSGNPMNGTSGGSWGVGKSVFNRCSRINTFLALTGRRAEGDAALIGKSLLWHHRINSGGEFQGLGQFGAKDADNAFMVLPETSPALVGRFIKDFALTRPVGSSEVEPGLSVVIPYADPDISAEGIAEIVIREYFHPILAGRLRVRISGRSGGKQAVVDLDRENLLEQAARLSRSETEPVLRLAQWSLGDGPRHAYPLKSPPAGEAPTWSDESLTPNDPAWSELCQRFERGEPVAINVPVRVNRRNQHAERAAFIVYLQRDLAGSGYRPVFVRGCIVVPNARQRAVRNQSLFSLVTIDEGPLAIMLRAAEPPAHTHWSADTANFRGRYDFGKQTIDFVVNAPKHLADTLSNARTDRDLGVWADLFPSPKGQGDRGAEGKSRKGKKRVVGPVEPPAPRMKPFRIDEVHGGFRIVRDNAASTALPGALEVRVAYDTSRGSPFNRYDPADFRLNKLHRVARDLQEVRCADNRIVVVPESDDFELEITGFDLNRDLVVKAQTVDNEPWGES
ncbi:MAG: hypothetical protein KF817_03645 [Phycisphaeraceae bacterium]|nr:hypothetical protein [Phycisphaeraceae bacterium]